jgi:hypothetical protein
MKTLMKYFGSSLLLTVVGCLMGAGVGYYYTHTAAGAMAALLVVIILSVLEVSISFDNAVVNATVLKDMSPLWQHRFLTWGMAIAVFGMRLIFPLLIVAVVASLNPWEALVMATLRPQEYAQIMLSVHHEVSSFGGAFLMLVALKYFFDENHGLQWIQMIERPLSKLGRLEAAEVGAVLLILWILSRNFEPKEGFAILVAGIAGVLSFLLVEGLGEFLKSPVTGGDSTTQSSLTVKEIHRASLGMFLYLEVLDASFSFDGVIGAFAITNNLFVIAIGLGIGALFVRSLTILMVEKGTLNAFVFLEHGAFYAVGALAAMMFLNVVIDIPEWITGLLGAAFIGISIISSIRHQKKVSQVGRH